MDFEKNISIVFGTRPEAIKILPIALELDKKGIKYSLIFTGQQEIFMVNKIVQKFNKVIDFNLNISSLRKTGSLSELTSLLSDMIGDILEQNNFSHIIVQGDTTTAMVSALIGFYNKLKIIHIEAGLRTNDKYSPFPEEINRRIISSLADIHCCPTEKNKQNLIQEMVIGNIVTTGNTVIDALEFVIRNNNKLANELLGFNDDYFLVTLHRRENLDKIKGICEVLKRLTEVYPIKLVLPMHPNKVIREILRDVFIDNGNVYLIEPLDYFNMVTVLKSSKFVVTDSGGIQEEAPYLGTPCFVVRNETERIETIESGHCKIIGTNPIIIEKILDEYLKSGLPDFEIYSEYPFGKKGVSELIVNLI